MRGASINWNASVLSGEQSVRSLDVGDDYPEDVKEALLYAHAEQINDDGQGLIWPGDPCDPFPVVQRETDWEKVIALY